MAKLKAEVIKRPIEHVGGEIKKSAWSAIFESLIVVALGILFVVWPDQMAQIVAYIVGIVLIVKGGFEVFNYFMDKGQNDFFNNKLLSGVVSILIGIVALVMGPSIANVFRIVLGILLIYESLVRLNTAIKLHSAGLNIWRVILVFALIILALGIFVTFNDAATVVGWIMIIAGIISVASDVVFIGQVDNFINKVTGAISGAKTTDSKK